MTENREQPNLIRQLIAAEEAHDVSVGMPPGAHLVYIDAARVRTLVPELAVEVQRLQEEIQRREVVASKLLEAAKEATIELDWFLSKARPGSYAATTTLVHLRDAIAAAELEFSDK